VLTLAVLVLVDGAIVRQNRNQLADRDPEALDDLVDPEVAVLDDVVQQGCGHGGLVEPGRIELLGDGERMADVGRGPVLSRLPVVGLGGELVGLEQQGRVPEELRGGSCLLGHSAILCPGHSSGQMRRRVKSARARAIMES